MTGGKIGVTVNDVPVRVWPWARWRDAVTAWRPAAGASLSAGEGVLQDGAGQPLAPEGHAVDGSEIRFRFEPAAAPRRSAP